MKDRFHRPKKGNDRTRRCLTLLAASALALAVVPGAHAQVETTNLQQGESQATANGGASSAPVYHFLILGNLGTGYGFATGQGYSGTSNGMQYVVGGLLSYVQPHWLLDGGINWYYSQLSGSVGNNTNAQVRTRAVLAELSPRYKLGDRWQLGPVIDLAFGTDTGFDPTVNGSKATALVGARAAYEMPAAGLPLRIYAQALTDLSTSRQSQMTMVTAGVQLGFPVPIGGPSEGSDVVATTSSAPLYPMAGEAPAASDLVVELEPQRIFFHTNSSNIRPVAETVLEDVGTYLAGNPEEWSQVQLAGHADQRGGYLYNLKLSGRRAVAVMGALTRNGADVSKMSIRAFSWLQPIDPRNNRDAWAKNRRVVLLFREVKHPEVLIDKLQPLTRKGAGNGPRLD